MAETAPTPRSDGSSDRGRALACAAAAIASDVDPATLQSIVREGLSVGVAEEQVIATLFAAAPLIGSVRLVEVAPKLAAAVGYDIDQAFEHLDGDATELELATDPSSIDRQVAAPHRRETP